MLSLNAAEPKNESLVSTRILIIAAIIAPPVWGYIVHWAIERMWPQDRIAEQTEEQSSKQ